MLLSFFSYRFEFMWKTSFSCIELEYLVHSICKSTIHFTTRTNICTMLIHLTKTGHKLAFNSCTCIIHTIICGSSTRIVWVVSVVLHIPLNSLYTVSFFLFVWHASTIEFLVTMATIYRTNIAWWIEIVIVAVQQIPTFFDMCFKNILPHV